MFGRGRTFDRIDLALQPGVTLADAPARARRPARTRLRDPAAGQPRTAGRGDARRLHRDGEHLEPRSRSSSGCSSSTTRLPSRSRERRSEIGILRALGATRGQIRWLFLGESVVLGWLGSVARPGVRRAHRARRSPRPSSTLVGELYGVAQRADDDRRPTRWLLATRDRRSASSTSAGGRGGAGPERRPRRSGDRRSRKGRYQVLVGRGQSPPGDSGGGVRRCSRSAALTIPAAAGGRSTPATR